MQAAWWAICFHSFSLGSVLSNTADKGTVPDSVIYSFYIGAAVLIACAVYTSVKVKEMPPKEFEEFHGITADEKKEKARLLLTAETCTQSILDGRLGTVILLGSLYVYVDLYHRSHCRYGMAYHRCSVGRIPRGRQIGSVFYLPYKPSVRFYGPLFCPCSVHASWPIP